MSKAAHSGVLQLAAEEIADKKREAVVPKGKIRIGLVQHVEGSKASIPSRFETILNTGVRENDAFGRRTYRFNEAENEMPGPGTYKARVSALKTHSDCSFSKKGGSQFIHKVGFGDEAPVVPTPGPGAYNVADFTAQLSAGSGPNKKTSAVFAAPTAKYIIRVARPAVENPGPGTYFRESNLKVPCAALTSRNPRRMVTAPANAAAAIGPGDYQTEQTMSTIKVRDPLKMSCFARSAVGRFGQSAAAGRLFPTVLPPILQAGAHESREDVPKVVAEIAHPGETSPGRTGMAAPSSKPKPSYMFSETNLDRFGRPVVQYTVKEVDRLGPGSYELEQKPKRMLISSSWALSGSTRDDIKDRYQPPGPAYYTPKPVASQVSHRAALPVWA
jgi:hypothetical protein